MGTGAYGTEGMRSSCWLEHSFAESSEQNVGK